MTSEHLTEELLHMRFDGELSSAEAVRADAHLATCAQCSKQLGELGKLRELVVMTAQEGARDVDFDAMFSRIERGTRETPALSMMERMRVWLEEMLEHKPAQLWAPAAGVLVAAAAVLMIARGANGPEGGATARKGPGPIVEDARDKPQDRLMLAEKADAVPAQAGPDDDAANGSEVVDVDFGDNTGTVFEIALADGVSTPVVWIND